MNRSHYRLQTHFTNWLQTPIYYSESTDTEKRLYMYRALVRDSMNRIKKVGYSFYSTEKEIEEEFMRIVYYLQEKRKYTFHTCDNGTEDDYNFYCFTLDHEWWNTFWKGWEEIDDISRDVSMGIKIKASLPLLLWMYIDLSRSSLTLTAENESDSEREEPVRSKRIDPYVLDQMNRMGTTTKAGRWE